jgi:tRNA (cmo5U34)-methyltransferase
MKIPNHWTFCDEEVARGFDEHVREQLPWYDLVTRATATIARSFLFDKAKCYEIGAATGNFPKAMESTIRDRRVDWTCVEPSALMAMKFEVPERLVRLVLADARDMRWDPFDLGVSFLALMFVPRADRRALLDRWFGELREGGALLLVEKFEPLGGTAGLVTHRLSIAMKREAGVDSTSIIDKELSLSGSQMPLDPAELALPGSRRTLFFKLGDFEGWIVEKR